MRRSLLVLVAAFAVVLVAACGDDNDGQLSDAELHDRLHEIAHEACEEIEGGTEAAGAIEMAIEEADDIGASEDDAREILEEECADLLE